MQSNDTRDIKKSSAPITGLSQSQSFAKRASFIEKLTNSSSQRSPISVISLSELSSLYVWLLTESSSSVEEEASMDVDSKSSFLYLKFKIRRFAEVICKENQYSCYQDYLHNKWYIQHFARYHYLYK